MLKKILVTLFIVPVIGAAIYGYFHFKQIKTPLSPVIQAIPSNAAFILKSNTPKASLQNFSLQQNIWKSLISYPFFGALHRDIHFIDGLFSQGSDALKQVADKPLFVSIHPDASNQFEFLYLINLPNTLTKKQVNDFILEAVSKEAKYNLRIYEGVALNELKLSENKALYYFFNKGIFACTFSKFLMEDAIRQLNSGLSLSADAAFDKVWNAAGKKVEATLFINYQYAAELLSHVVDAKEAGFLKSLAGFANWTCLDLKSKKDAYQLTGFTFSKDSSNNYLSVFKNQEAQEMDIVSQFPAASAYFQWHGLSDVNRYFKNYDTYLNNLTNHYSRQEQLLNLNKKYGVNAQNFFKQWIGNQFAYVVYEPGTENIMNSCYAVFKTNGTPSVHSTLLEFSSKVNTKQNAADTLNEIFRGYPIQHIAAENLVPLVFGETFEKLKNTYFVEMDKVVVVGNSAGAIKKWINSVLAKQTLKEDLDYQSFAENISSQSSIYIYSALARSSRLFQNSIKKDVLNWNDSKTETLKNFHATALQVSAKPSMFYSSIYASYKPCYKKPPASIWEIELDTTVHQRPYVLLDPADNSTKLLVQDDAHKIYLIDNSGKIMWKRELKEKIGSEVQTLNIGKKGEMQILFSTQTKIYLLDDEGDNVGKFPVVLKYLATNGVQAVDYDDNGSYRFLIAEENKRIYNFTQKGEAVNGWEAVVNTDKIVSAIRSFRAKGLDYLVVVDQSGNVNLLDRKGKSVVKFKQKLKNLYHGQYTLAVDETLNSSSVLGCDSSGKVTRLYFSGKISQVEVVKTRAPFYFYADASGSKFVYVFQNKLEFYGGNFVKKTETKLNLSQLFSPAFFTTNNGDLMVSLAEEGKKTMLISEDGLVVSEIECAATTAPMAARLFGDASWYTVLGAGKKVIAFAAY